MKRLLYAIALLLPLTIQAQQLTVTVDSVGKLASQLPDSIRFSKEDMSFTYYGRQRIERRTSVLMRELVTEGFLKRVPRTENNPHGLLIVNWRTILNKDLEQRTKSNY